MSLRIKILVSVSVIIFIVLGTSTFLHIRNLQKNYLEALEWRFEALSNGMRGEIVSWIGQERDPQKVTATLKGSAFQCRTVYDLNKDKSVLHVAVLNSSGIIAAHNDRELQGTQMTTLTIMDALQRHKQTIVLDGNAYHALIPIFSGEDYIGTVDIGFPKQLVDEKIRQLLLQSTALLVVFLVVAFFAVSLLVHWLLTKPIKHLVQLGTHIAHGELVLETLSSQTGRAAASANPSKNSDEIAVLTGVFHEMIDYLYDVTDIATRVATGDLSREVQPRSDRDVLGKAFQQMSAYLTHMASIATAMASGDLRQQIDQPDEHDILGTAFHNMDTLRQSIARIMEESSKLRHSSDSLSHISTQMTSDARQTSEKVQAVSSNSQQVSGSMELLAIAMKGISSSINEISTSISDVTEIITEAVTIANNTNETLATLENRSQEIGDITKVITTITQQTNLLALNATIEAARAGESGKGFTVVANEIKDLSREIAGSTEDITHKINAMQSICSSVTTAIADVHRITNHVHELSQTITTSVEEQTTTMHEISSNIADASQRSHETSETIAEVADVTQNTMKQAITVEQAAEELATLADQLQQFVGIFKT